MTKDLFCGRCNEATPHEFEPHGSGEIIAHCQNIVETKSLKLGDDGLPVLDANGNTILEPSKGPCPGFQKFVASSSEELQAQIDRHNEHNVPRITAEMESAANAQIQSIIDGLA